MKKALTIFVFLLAVVTATAQMQDPVHVRSELKTISDTEAELLFSATIDAGWHVYSTGLGNDGPISATFHTDKMEGAKAVGPLKTRGKELKVFDKIFEMEVRYFEKGCDFRAENPVYETTVQHRVLRRIRCLQRPDVQAPVDHRAES